MAETEAASPLRISIIIPTLNEEGYIGYVLEDLAAQRRKPDEVIVVDGRSKDATAEIVKRFPFATLLTHSPSPAAQRNIGAKAANGDLMVFLDADDRLEPAFLERAVREFQRRHLDAASALLWPHQASLTVHSLHAFYNIFTTSLQRFIPIAGGPCIIVKRELFLTLGGFSDMRFEDLDFVRRAGKRHRYGILQNVVFVSDRRFRKEGTLRLGSLYVFVFFLFLLRQYQKINSLTYRFGHHDKPKTPQR